MTVALMTLRHVGKAYAGRFVLQDITLSLAQGEAVAVLGKNGAGKSTLLKLIGGISAMSQGERIVHRTGGQLSIGFVPERFPKIRMTGLEYLRHMGAISGLPKQQLSHRLSALLDKFELENEAAKRPCRQYSKGMLQKINLIQALIRPPELLLLDEPLSGLDASSQETIIRVLMELKQEGVAVVFTSHERGLAEGIAQKFVTIINGRSCLEIRSDRHSPAYKFKVVECVIPQNHGTNEWLVRQGFRFSRKTTNSYAVHVNESDSDRFLKAVLEIGGHIESVSNAESSPSSSESVNGGGD